MPEKKQLTLAGSESGECIFVASADGPSELANILFSWDGEASRLSQSVVVARKLPAPEAPGPVPAAAPVPAPTASNAILLPKGAIVGMFAAVGVLAIMVVTLAAVVMLRPPSAAPSAVATENNPVVAQAAPEPEIKPAATAPAPAAAAPTPPAAAPTPPAAAVPAAPTPVPAPAPKKAEPAAVVVPDLSNPPPGKMPLKTTIQGTGGVAGYISFMSDGKRFYCWRNLAKETEIDFWDLQSVKLISTIKVPGYCQFRAEGNTVITFSNNTSPQCWTLDTGDKHPITGLSNALNDLAFMPKGKSFATRYTSSSGSTYFTEISIVDLETFAVTERFRIAGSVHSLAFSPDEAILATSASSEVVLWNRASREEIKTLKADTSVSVSLGPKGLEACSGNKMVSIDPKMDKITMTEPDFVIPEGFTVCKDRSRAYKSQDGAITVIALPSGEVLGVTAKQMDLSGTAISPDGRWLAAGLNDGKIKLWEIPGPQGKKK